MGLSIRTGKDGAGLLWGAARPINTANHQGHERLVDGCPKATIIVFANEKGGTGKSTTAVHVAIALQAQGARVSAFDLDHRQRTMGRYLDNRQATAKRTGRELHAPPCDA